jgi:hypothetical protein
LCLFYLFILFKACHQKITVLGDIHLALLWWTNPLLCCTVIWGCVTSLTQCTGLVNYIVGQLLVCIYLRQWVPSTMRYCTAELDLFHNKLLSLIGDGRHVWSQSACLSLLSQLLNKLTDFYKAWREVMSYNTIPLQFSSFPSVRNNSMVNISTYDMIVTPATLNLGSWSVVIVKNLQQLLRPHWHPTEYNVKFGMEIWIVHMIWFVGTHHTQAYMSYMNCFCKFTFNKHSNMKMDRTKVVLISSS